MTIIHSRGHDHASLSILSLAAHFCNHVAVTAQGIKQHYSKTGSECGKCTTFSVILSGMLSCNNAMLMYMQYQQYQ